MDWERLASAIRTLKDNAKIMQTFGPDSLPGAMACTEANDFSELFDALGMIDEAAQLRKWHLYVEDEEAEENHPHWPEVETGEDNS